ncbi:MAG: RidA family protein [Chloroflexi bacterium]|nr:RidA family protein [Chloroflexota bacterium]
MPITKHPQNHGLPWEDSFFFTQALKVGDTIYISGQFSHDDDGTFVGTGDVEAQIRQTYENIKKLLAKHGATIDNVVEEVVFVTDAKAAFQIVADVRKEVYAGLIPPANTLVQVGRLSLGRQLVEIKCVARI